MPAEDTDLLVLQGNIKRDPEGYLAEFETQLRRYRASVEVFSLAPTRQSKDFPGLVTFLAQVSICFPERPSTLPAELMQLLDSHFSVLHEALRHTVLKAIILLHSRKQVSAAEAFPFFLRMLQCPDRVLRTLAFRHMLSDVKAANQRQCNEQLNRTLQNMLFSAVADANEVAARQSLSMPVELWRRHVWRDSRTVSVIATALLHPSMRVALPALKFFLGQDEAAGEKDNDDDSDGAAGEDMVAMPSRADVYKATSKGTAASKKKKKAKLQRVLATVRRAARKGKADRLQSFAAIQLLRDPQDLAEKLLARAQRAAGERWEARLALLQVTSRIVGVHRLLLLNLYPLLHKYLQPHQRDVPALLAILVQACHDLVPPETLQPVLHQIVDGFVQDRARPEVVTLGLRTVRELCVRLPLVMTPELLQDLALYRKFREKEVASAARSLISLFRELAPVMLEKRDRGRGADATLTVRAYGTDHVADRIVGADLLQAELLAYRQAAVSAGGSCDPDQAQHDPFDLQSDCSSEVAQPDQAAGPGNGMSISSELAGRSHRPAAGHVRAAGNARDGAEAASASELQENADVIFKQAAIPSQNQHEHLSTIQNRRKRRLLHQQPGSLVAMRKQLAASQGAKRAKGTPATDAAGEVSAQPAEQLLEQQRFLTSKDFDRIRELRQQKLVETAMAKHGLKSAAKHAKLLTAAQDEAEAALEAADNRRLEGESRLDPDSLQGKHRLHQSKAERLASVMQGRQGNVYGAAASKKKQKLGGLSNKEKQKRKALPYGARSQKSAQRQGAKAHRAGKSFKGRVKGSRHK